MYIFYSDAILYNNIISLVQVITINKKCAEHTHSNAQHCQNHTLSVAIILYIIIIITSAETAALN